MTREEIIGELARARVVETILKNIAKVDTLSPNLQDLVQMVYLALLEYDEDKICGLHERREMPYFISRILITNITSPRSKWLYEIKRFTERITDYKGYDRPMEEDNG